MAVPTSWPQAADAELEKRLDGYIDRIAAAAAKDPDGYLNTWTQLMAPNHRWGLNGGNDVQQHDVYNAGAMVEAAVHYYRATGKTRLLQVATKLANHMADVMGPPPKKNVVPGHSLGEEALVKLYLLFREQPELKSRMPVPVEEQRYLKLAEFWIENRGNHEGRQSYGAYAQDHKPVLQQETIEGHAVRATLLCAGLVAAGDRQRPRRLSHCGRGGSGITWSSVGCMSSAAWARWPATRDSAPITFCRTTAISKPARPSAQASSISNMNLAFADARYADELERVLYNGVLSGRFAEGRHLLLREPARSRQEPDALGVARLSLLPADVPQDHGRLAGLHLCPGSRRRLREPVRRQPCEPDREWRQGRSPTNDPLSMGWRGPARLSNRSGRRSLPSMCACPPGALSRS